MAAVEERAQEAWGRDGGKAPTQARLAREVELVGRMRVDEMVDDMAEALQERGGAEASDTANRWRVGAMEKQAARFSPLEMSRSAVSPDGCRWTDEEFEALIALWMGVPVLPAPCPCPTAHCGQQLDVFGVHGAMACGGASEGHAVKNALSRRHNHLAKQLCFGLGTGGVPAMLEQRGWDGSKKRPGDVTCDSAPLGLPGRRTIFDVTVAALLAHSHVRAVVKALGTQLTKMPRAWVVGKVDMGQAVGVATAGAREKKWGLYTDQTMERRDGVPDVLRPGGVLLPDEKLFIVSVSALGALGANVSGLMDAMAECWKKRGAASSAGMAKIAIRRSWRLSLWRSCAGALASRLRAAAVGRSHVAVGRSHGLVSQ